ncbi:hypothetical protein [Aquibium sp. ELW1220]|uniref:hypothetical protein n=1 Tax=Aquibium sp. ELW1220 TaxID=2976766 RepID=UPI0025AF1618|nr:hypothetical protein [Aquibium sp. ELW1220]MDN2583282.1 hypothetical protein [Aquibium sp. ELW1220]
MKIENFTRLVQEASRDARVTTGVNKYGDVEPKAGLTSGGRFVEWVKNRKEYVAQNQTARNELAKSLTETYGEGFDVKRLKMAPGRALTVGDVAVWIKRAETYTARVGKQNETMAKATVRDFDATVKQVALEKKFTAPIHPKLLEATRVLVEQTIARRPPNLPPIGGESAKEVMSDLIGGLIDGLRKHEQNVDGSLRFKDRPLLERVIGFAHKTSLTGVDFSRVLKEVATAPVDRNDKTLPEVYNRAVDSSARVVDFLRTTDLGDADSLCGNIKELMHSIGLEMEEASILSEFTLKMKKLDPDQTTSYISTAIATGILRLDDHEVAKLSKTLKSQEVRDLLGLLSGIGAGFPQDARGMTFYAYAGETNIIAKKTETVLQSIITAVANHPMSGSFTSGSVQKTEFRKPDDVPENIMQAVKNHQGFEDGVLMTN